MSARKGFRPPAAGMGRKRGSQNRFTRALKDLISGALSEVGGQAYLVEQARANPATFLTLVGKVLPLQVKAGGDDPTLPPRRIVHEHRPAAEPVALPQPAAVQRVPTRVGASDARIASSTAAERLHGHAIDAVSPCPKIRA